MEKTDSLEIKISQGYDNEAHNQRKKIQAWVDDLSLTESRHVTAPRDSSIDWRALMITVLILRPRTEGLFPSSYLLQPP